MATIRGNFTSDHRIATFEARQLEEGWEIKVGCAGVRVNETTLAVSPWPLLEKLTGQVLDTASRQPPESDFDMNRPKKAPSREQTSERKRRTKLPPGSLPNSQISADLRAQMTETIDGEKQVDG
jgi:hypothetical protein